MNESDSKACESAWQEICKHNGDHDWVTFMLGWQAALAHRDGQRGEPVASIYITPCGEREFDDWKHDLPVGRNTLYTHPAPQPAQGQQGPVGFRYKTRSIKYPENGWSGWHFQEGVPANYHLTDDGNFEFLTRLLYDHSTPDVAPTEVVRELYDTLQAIIADGVHCDVVPHLHRRGIAALKSAKEHGL